MIVVRFTDTWWWTCPELDAAGAGYTSAEHALRDAWTWLGRNVPALIYTRRP